MQERFLGGEGAGTGGGGEMDLGGWGINDTGEGGGAA